MTSLAPIEADELAPVAEDLSIWLIPGRAKDPSLAITQAVDAERPGFRRVFLSERFDLKDAGALLEGCSPAPAASRRGPGSWPRVLEAR